MEHLYNPEQMSEQEIKDTFVARTALVDKLVDTVRQQREGAGVQHIVLVAPRGMGKTTVLLMVQFAVQDIGPDSPWLALRFPEELYGVNDLADFWLETLDCLSSVTQDKSLQDTITNLKVRYPDSDNLQEAAVAALRGWCREHGRRLLLLVDNFNQILAQINDEKQNAALRNVLMNEGFLMILGAAPSFFKEASNYNEPLYNFFKIEHLNRLSFEDTLALMRRRADADGLTDFANVLESNTARLRALEYFAHGNVRLILMLYRVVSRTELFEVRQGLEKLLDQVTPFFKAKTEDLPPQQRKILDYIARTASQTHDGVSPTEIAKSVRMSPQAVSTQLKRLSDQGYVEPANMRGRSSFYVLSEPLYSLWYQMRFGRNSRQRVGWLTSFLRAWYDDVELGVEVYQLEEMFQKLLNDGDLDNARKTLENHRLITEALSDDFKLAHCLDTLVNGYIALKETNRIQEIVSTYEAKQLNLLTELKLHNSGYLAPERALRLRENLPEYRRLAQEGVELLRTHKFDQVLRNADLQVEIMPTWFCPWFLKAVALNRLMKPEEALISINNALELNPKDADLLRERASIYKELRQIGLAHLDLNAAIQLKPQDAVALCSRGQLLLGEGDLNSAIHDLTMAVTSKPDYVQAWLALGQGFLKVENRIDALDAFEKALAVDPNNLACQFERLALLNNMGRFEDSAMVLDHIQELCAAESANAEQSTELQKLLDQRLTLVHDMKNSIHKWRVHTASLKALRALKESAEAYKTKQMDTARHKWIEGVTFGIQSDKILMEDDFTADIESSWEQHAITILVNATLIHGEKQSRQLITQANADEIFFPLARALDYVSTNNESLIEKLTPEMRPIVKEVIEKLSPSSTTT